ncbi:unnamed protein product [Ilex paraguariensis]|uniref:C2H2-type domain-containing protein n=1 Tax=Ilex paraguariensis TaxID=185542 RepID=A0ABC8RD90_9AQUA
MSMTFYRLLPFNLLIVSLYLVGMESTHKEDSMISGEEVDQPEQDNTDGSTTTGRSYECVFCKRGFTTAQALGGHMNIHRKDRARNKPTINSTKHEENHSHTGPIFYQPISSYPPRYSSPHEAQMNYRTYFPASTSNTKPLFQNHNNNSHDRSPQRSLFGEDCRMSLSLKFGTAHAESAEDELDLELRLGHNP